jgi:hypothetical protein
MSASVKPVYWVGQPDANCDLCGNPIGKLFVDGRTRMGSWANMCRACHSAYGLGVGTGKGQRFQKQPDGRWLKTGG